LWQYLDYKSLVVAKGTVIGRQWLPLTCESTWHDCYRGVTVMPLLLIILVHSWFCLLIAAYNMKVVLQVMPSVFSSWVDTDVIL